MRRLEYCIVLLLLIFAVLPLSAQRKPVTIGVVIDGPWEGNAGIQRQTINEITTLTANEFDVRFPADKILTADWTIENVRKAVHQLLEDPEVDLILTMGMMASGVGSRERDLAKPLIAPFIVDAKMQGLPMRDDGTTGVKNLHYITFPSRISRDIKLFQEIVPFYKVTLLTNSETFKTIPNIEAQIDSTLREMEVDPEVVGVGRNIDAVLDLLTEDTEAVYVAALMQLSASDFDKLVTTLKERKIPSFSLMGQSEVERGIMATANPGIMSRIVRRVALNVQRILLGDEPGELQTHFTPGEKLIINMAVAREIGISPPFSVLTEAVLINEQRSDVARQLGMPVVVREALEENLDLRAEQFFVEAGRQNVNLARSPLLPQIGVSATGLLIDEDRASASFGSQPQRSISGSIDAQQLVFNEKVWANYSIQKSLQRSRKFDLEQLRLDIVQEAVTSYLNVLRGKTFETIQKENLRRTRQNLELAQVREAIGFSGRSEVYRWEAEISAARNDVIQANTSRNLAEIDMNRLLNRPLEESFRTDDVGLDEPSFRDTYRGLLVYFDDPLSFKTFRSFVVQEGMLTAPELLALDALIAARQREYRSTTNAFWMPSIGLQGGISHIFSKTGAGATGPDLPAGINFPIPDNTSWDIALAASLPIFQGGSRLADRSRAGLELKDLQITRDAAAQRIEQRIRSSLHITGASRARIQLSSDAAIASNKNLELVTDAYSIGTVDIIVLLDAQVSALSADLAAANAVYDFIVDLMEVERSIGGTYYLAEPAERSAWLQRLQDFFNAAGITPNQPR